MRLPGGLHILRAYPALFSSTPSSPARCIGFTIRALDQSPTKSTQSARSGLFASIRCTLWVASQLNAAGAEVVGRVALGNKEKSGLDYRFLAIQNRFPILIGPLCRRRTKRSVVDVELVEIAAYPNAAT